MSENNINPRPDEVIVTVDQESIDSQTNPLPETETEVTVQTEPDGTESSPDTQKGSDPVPPSDKTLESTVTTEEIADGKPTVNDLAEQFVSRMLKIYQNPVRLRDFKNDLLTEGQLSLRRIAFLRELGSLLLLIDLTDPETGESTPFVVITESPTGEVKGFFRTQVIGSNNPQTSFNLLVTATRGLEISDYSMIKLSR